MTPKGKPVAVAARVTYIVYHAVIQIIGQIEGGIPKDPDVMKTWLMLKGQSGADVYQKTLEAMDNSANAEELQDEAMQKNWCGFRKGPKGLYIEARQFGAALKEAANVLKVPLGITAARARLAERVRVSGIESMYQQEVYLGVEEPTGYKDQVVHVKTRFGLRDAIKRSDYVENPRIEFNIRVLNDGVFTLGVLQVLLNYVGTMSGLGANRSQAAGMFEVISIEKLQDSDAKKAAAA